MEKAWALLQWCNQAGVWGLIWFLTFVVGCIIKGLRLIWAKRTIKHLNFTIGTEKDQSNYPLKITLQIRNYTGRSVIISHAYFRYRGLRRDAKATGDTLTGRYEVKFPDRNGRPLLTEIDCFLRHGEHVPTWIPLDPKHTDQQVADAIEKRRAGRFTCSITCVEEKPKSLVLKKRV